MSDKKNVPKIRFPGFTEPWEQRKFGEITELKSASRVHKDEWTSNGVPFYRSSDVMAAINGTENEKAFISEELYEKLSKVSGKLEEGDILVTGGGSVGNPYIVTNNKPLYTKDADLLWIKNKGKFHPYFLYEFFFSPTFRNYLGSISHVGTIAHYTITQLSDTPICLPSFDEQKEVGEYFQSLDNLITLHQRKLEHVKKMKKSMLQKMFPKKNQLYPEVRFPGFTDAWEQRKFSEFTWNAGKRNKEDLDLEPYAITNEHGFIKQSEAHDDFGYMKDTDRKAYNIVMPNSFAYNPARINVGSIGYYEGTENVIVSSLYEVFQTADYVDDRFLWHWFKSDEFPKWIERLQEGSVRLYFYYDKLCECQMLMPSVPEQKKIAEALDNLDNLITLHQRELDHLQLLKKGMLQQMFI